MVGKCGLEQGSLQCFSFTAPDPNNNPCQSCSWWDDFCRCPVCGAIECECEGE
jgi:hypothetical protein